ncbi:MAG: head GIN domain-containing protein, partial [Bacteroidota bacterium]
MNTRFAWLIAIMFAASSMLSGCFLDDFPCVNADNVSGTETFTVNDPFVGLKLSFPGDVNITQDTAVSIVANGSQNLLDVIEVIVQDSILIIDADNICVLNSDVVFDISLPEVAYLAISGSGSMVSTAPIQTQDIELKISGSGDLDLDLNADEIEGKISGSGDVALAGTSNDLDFKISGAGSVEAFGLTTSTAELK